MSAHPGGLYDPKKTKGETKMESLLQIWLNPINLGILFLCITIGIWILAHSDPTQKGK